MLVKSQGIVGLVPTCCVALHTYNHPSPCSLQKQAHLEAHLEALERLWDLVEPHSLLQYNMQYVRRSDLTRGFIFGAGGA